MASVSDYRIALDVRGCDGPLNGTVRLDLTGSLIDDRSGEVLTTEQARYGSGVVAPDIEVSIAAMNVHWRGSAPPEARAAAAGMPVGQPPGARHTKDPPNKGGSQERQ